MQQGWQVEKMTMQALSPFLYDKRVFICSEELPKLNKVLECLAEKYQVTCNAIAVAWIMLHPAGIQAIVGSTQIRRMQVRLVMKIKPIPKTE